MAAISRDILAAGSVKVRGKNSELCASLEKRRCLSVLTIVVANKVKKIDSQTI